MRKALIGMGGGFLGAGVGVPMTWLALLWINDPQALERMTWPLVQIGMVCLPIGGALWASAAILNHRACDALPEEGDEGVILIDNLAG